MDEHDWKEEQQSVIGRLFDSLFGRREASEEEIGRDIHWLGTVNRHLDDDDYSITSSARTSSVGETETAGPQRSPMTELLRQYSPEPKSRSLL